MPLELYFTLLHHVSPFQSFSSSSRVFFFLLPPYLLSRFRQSSLDSSQLKARSSPFFSSSFCSSSQEFFERSLEHEFFLMSNPLSRGRAFNKSIKLVKAMLGLPSSCSLLETSRQRALLHKRLVAPKGFLCALALEAGPTKILANTLTQ